MLRRIFVVALPLILLSSLVIHEVCAQDNRPPMVPPVVVYGTASVDNVPLTQSDTDKTISIRMAELLIIFYDSVDYQDDIADIVNGLNTDNTIPLAQAFLDSTYCQNYDPPIVLSGTATVNTISGNEWEVTDGSKKYSARRAAIQVWNGGWVSGWKLEVYLRKGNIALYPMGSMPPAGNYHVLEIPLASGDVLWGNGTYVLREPGHAMAGDLADICINDIRVSEINGTPVGPLPYTIGTQSFEELDINAPSLYTVDIPLAVGWNMFSLPVATLSTNPPDVLDTITNLYNSVWAFDVDAGWTIYAPGSSSDLQEIVPRRGYWIKMDLAGTLTVQGTDPDVTEIPLRGNAWNLVGYCSRQTMNVADAVSSISTDINSVWGFKPVQGWLIYTPGGASDLEFMYPGDAFWIKANVDCDWDVNQ